MFQNEQFINDFVDEASSHAERFEIDLLTLESERNNKELINSLFRAIHSIKGTAGFLGLNKIVRFSHSMESVLGKIKSNEITVNDKIIETFLKSLDYLKVMIKKGFKSEELEIKEYTDELDKLADLNEKKTEESKDESSDINTFEDKVESSECIKEITYIEDKLDYLKNSLKFGKRLYSIIFIETQEDYKNNVFKEMDELGDLIIFKNENNDSFYFCTILEKDMINLVIEDDKCFIEEINIKEELEKLSLTHENQDKVNQDEVNQELEFDFKPSDFKDLSSETIRVSVSLLNKLLDISSEMVLRRNQLLNQLSKHNIAIPELNSLMQNIDFLTTEIQEKVMQTRLQPLNNIFNKLPRLVRDLCKNLNKDVNIMIKGGEVELDKSIIEALMDPFIHLIRNSIDHGIEISDERVKKGKKSKGEIIIKAYHESSFVNIDIIDDGRGLSIPKIKNRALSMGYSLDYLESISKQELINFIFEPGFSTAEEVTDISGRGVGMNVLKSNIEKLGGTIEVSSDEDLGTRVRLILPLTMAIIPSLILGVSDFRFVIAKSNLQEIMKIDEKEIRDLNGAKAINLRDDLIPIVYLSDILKIENKNKKNKVNIIVVKLKEKRFGIVVDSIFDEEEILVKKLPKYFKSILCYSGMTVLGDGRTAMILDPDGIVSMGNLIFEDNKKNESEDEVSEVENSKNLLIFNGVGEETYAIDLKYVSRVKQIDRNSIEKIGNGIYIQYEDKPVKSIYIEDYLKYSKKEYKDDKLYIILLKGFENELGIIIRKIYDTFEMNLDFDESLKSEFILGSFIYNKKITILPDIDSIVENTDFTTNT